MEALGITQIDLLLRGSEVLRYTLTNAGSSESLVLQETLPLVQLQYEAYIMNGAFDEQMEDLVATLFPDFAGMTFSQIYALLPAEMQQNVIAAMVVST